MKSSVWDRIGLMNFSSVKSTMESCEARVF